MANLSAFYLQDAFRPEGSSQTGRAEAKYMPTAVSEEKVKRLRLNIPWIREKVNETEDRHEEQKQLATTPDYKSLQLAQYYLFKR